MDKHLIAAVNKILSKKYERTTIGRCYCEAASSNISVVYPNEAMSRCAAWNITNRNVSIIFPIISDFLQDYLPYSSGMLRGLIKFLLTSVGMEGKTKIMATLERHLMVHPSCATHMIGIYEDLLLSKHEDFGNTTLLDFLLTKLEDQTLKGRACVLNIRLSRNNRKKKLDSCYVYDEPEPKRSKRQAGNHVEEEPTEILDEDPTLKFVLLRLIAVILRHDFYSKLHRSKSEKGNCIERTIIGRIFLHFDDKMNLNADLTGRIIEIYRNCESPQQQIINDILELVADLCLFLDSGKLTVDDNILEAMVYPTCQQFCQHFCPRVFRGNTIEDALVIVKSLRPEWLRLNAAFHLFRQKWKTNIDKGLKSIFQFMDNSLRKIHQTELKNVLKTLNVHTQSWSSNAISEIQDKLMSACRSNDVAILRKLSKTGDIDFQLTDQAGCNILHVTSKYGSLECAKFLLEFYHKNINVDVKDAKGVTPLAYALQYDNSEICQLLLEYGATPLKPSDEKFDISSQAYDAIFKKKLDEETSDIIFYLYKSFMSTYHLAELLKTYEQFKKEGRTDEPVDKRNYAFFAQELDNYVDLKKVVFRITQFKNVPVYVDILKSI